MKKIIALALSVLLAASMCTISFADDQENVVGNYCPADTTTPIKMLGADYETLGAVISTVGDVTRIALVCPSWSDNVGNLTVTIWKWDTDYQTTIKGTPIAGPEVFEDYEDNSPLGFDFETPLPAGVYYAELSNAEDEAGSGVGVWSAEVNYPGQAVLRDGEYIPKLALRMYVDYVTAPEGDPYGELPAFEKPKRELGNDEAAPCSVYFKMSEQDLSMFGVGDQCELSENDDGTLHVFVQEDAFDCKYDLRFANYFDMDDDIPCQEYPYIAIRLKLANLEYNAGSGEAFFYTTTINGVTCKLSGSGGTVDLVNNKVLQLQDIENTPTLTMDGAKLKDTTYQKIEEEKEKYTRRDALRLEVQTLTEQQQTLAQQEQTITDKERTLKR